MNSTWITSGILLEATIFFAGWLAYKQGVFTHLQMVATWGWQCLPFLNHGGMWCEVFLVAPSISYLIGDYGEQWSMPAIVTMSILGILGSMGMHGVYSAGNGNAVYYGDCLTSPDGLRPAGVLHVMFMACAFTVLLLFYFATSNVQPRDLAIITIVFVVHLGIAVLQPTWHVVHKINPTVWATAISGWVGLMIGTACVLVVPIHNFFINLFGTGH